MNRIERIQEMEEALNTSRAAIDGLNGAVVTLVDALDGLQELSAYYGSGTWHRDREADDQDKIPADLPCSVLSEDLPYELLVDARDTALGTLEAATALLRSLS